MSTNGHNQNQDAKAISASLSIEWPEPGVAIVWMDVPKEAVNTLKANFSEELHRVIDELEQKNAQAAVIASRKKDNFVAGADIEMLKAARTRQDAEDLSRVAQQTLDRLAKVAFPVVAAIDGSCLGGGLELALACSARVASSNKKTVLGLPEVQLGLIPGAGGTQRLPRLVGLEPAVDMILTGKQVRADKAKKLGLVDDVVPEAILTEVALQKAKGLSAGKSSKKSGASWKEIAFAKNPLGRLVFFSQARKQLLKKTHGHYPAPEHALDVIRKGLEDGMAAGLLAEARAFGELVMSAEAQRLMEIFFATTALKKDNGVDDPNVQAKAIHKVAMLGAGLMGSGIAFATAFNAKISMRLKDRDDAGAGKGLKHVTSLVQERVKRKQLSRREAEEVMARVSVTTDYEGFKGVDVVIEAVFEDIAVKHSVLQETERASRADTIFASNTSSLPITKVAEASAHPETVIGMHYFSPVEKMPLLEIIVTEKTAPWVTATCVELGKKQGKTVIVVRDGVGFYTTRILTPYMNEGAHLLAEGVPVEVIDKALVDFGFPVGPITLMDEVGIDVGTKVGHIVYEAFGERMLPPQNMQRLIADKRFGKKNQRGFYVYGQDKKKGKKEVDASVYAVFGVVPSKRMDAKQIEERCVLQMLQEAARCLDERILRSPRDGDIGAVFGLGFPPFRGGPFRYMDTVGIGEIVRQMKSYQAMLGQRFAPPPILVRMAERNETFFPASASAKTETQATQSTAPSL